MGPEHGLVTVSGASSCVRRRIPISACLDKRSAPGVMPAKWEIVVFLCFRLVTGSGAVAKARAKAGAGAKARGGGEESPRVFTSLFADSYSPLSL